MKQKMILMHQKKTVIFLPFLLLLVLIFPYSALATPYTGTHAYDQQRVDANMTGIYMGIANDQDDLIFNGADGTFITKEMWLKFSNSEWIEVGTTKGKMDVDGTFINWNGHYMAWDQGSTYHERNFGTEYPTGSHNFEISTLNGTWTVYIDYGQIATIPAFDSYNYAIGHVVGIETSDSSNSFVNGTYAYAMQYRDNQSGTWVTWDGAAPYSDNSPQGDDLGWTTNYDSSINRLYFNHN